MTTIKMIKILCIRMNMSVSELARKIDQSPQNFSAKLRRNSLSHQEMSKIAEVLGLEYEYAFILDNGEKISNRGTT